MVGLENLFTGLDLIGSSILSFLSFLLVVGRWSVAGRWFVVALAVSLVVGWSTPWYKL
jgi:hypothetical protein